MQVEGRSCRDRRKVGAVKMTPHLKYLWYVIRHKWFVFLAGRKTGAPLWRLIIHDWSKFTKAEWTPYVETFYTDKEVKDDFDRAWSHHQHKNPHHWQHWVLREDSGRTTALEIPEDLIREMVADWAGAGRAITGRWSVEEWYGANRNKMIFHPRTALRVDSVLSLL